MNLQLDFIPFQVAGGVGGAAGFAKAVSERIFQEAESEDRFFATYDSSLPDGGLCGVNELAERHHVQLFDIHSGRLGDFTRANNIDTLFIAIGQFYAPYDLTGIQCKTIMFIHDIFDVERLDNLVDLTIIDQFKESRWTRMKRFINILSGRWHKMVDDCYGNIIPLYASPSTVAYTVSNYTRYAIRYHFPQLKKDIKVCYSPMREVAMGHEIENGQLRDIISHNRPYLLMLAANRRYKNPQNVIKVFRRILQEHPDLYLITLKYGKATNSHHIDIAFLSDSDLQHAYKHALALLFPSFFEGFGYPPVEAMRYGTPAIASNVTSIPEILGDAAIYVSPFYPADLYKAITELIINRNSLSSRLEQRYRYIAQKQEEDMQQLIKCIYSIKS